MVRAGPRKDPRLTPTRACIATLADGSVHRHATRGLKRATVFLYYDARTRAPAPSRARGRPLDRARRVLLLTLYLLLYWWVWLRFCRSPFS